MPRFLAAKPTAELLQLPWQVPLADWPTQHLVALPRGISRHVVRFLAVGEDILAAKEILEEVSVHEYRLLTELKRLGVPSVEPVGVVLGRVDVDGDPLDPILLTRHLPFSLPYRSLFYPGVKHETVNRLLDAMVALFARLHLTGFYWGDVSLSNILFRRDAGEFAAYLVDAETGELHDTLTDGQRAHDLQIARTNLYGEFLDLEAGGILDASLDPKWLVATIEDRYHQLWSELTGVEEFDGSEMYRLEGRVRRLNALGFDVAEIDVEASPDGRTIKMRPKVVEAGHHTRRLMRLTGLDAEEHQARRLLNDMDTFRAKFAPGAPESVAAHKWLVEVFEPAVNRIPADLRAKRDAAQFFHEVLDYRWYQSQRENREVPTDEAATGYIHEVLTQLPDEEMVNVDPVGGELANKYDPSHGYVDDNEEKPYDPWEDEANDPEVPVMAGFDIAALRAKAAAKEARGSS
ncbi:MULTISPECIES: DUF4032 domain-containing protein [Tessaracoccus]|uniref:DUF4032 domain-containing protein n=1 Tax=Tessaracoccus TaxID=72763 RepID=UPI00099DE429|nr:MULTISPECIES: DUF4032 domain-containing protein [Tessaracoccus]AQX15395.1 lipopolysaccharide kinase [Tessaracoccus sp. T2.5-30]VEP39691.1 hypothetical protein TLA_TLA_01068 [Tessaracoccus lapidicaptus]